MKSDNWSPEELLEIEANRSPDYECRLQDDIVCKRKKGKALAIYYEFLVDSYKAHAYDWFPKAERYKQMKDKYVEIRNKYRYRIIDFTGEQKKHLKRCYYLESLIMKNAYKSEYYKIMSIRTSEQEKKKRYSSLSNQFEIKIDDYIEAYDAVLRERGKHNPIHKNVVYKENKRYLMDAKFEKSYTNDPSYNYYNQVYHCLQSKKYSRKNNEMPIVTSEIHSRNGIEVDNVLKSYNKVFEKSNKVKSNANG